MRIWIKLTVFILFFTINQKCLAIESSWHFTSQDVTSLHSQPPEFRLHYGNDPLQFADLRLPKGQGLHPVVIIIHGGCWVSKFADLQNISALADAIRDLGVATWNIEYRRTDNTGGGWPGTFNDIANATDFLNKIADRYSLDLNRVIVVGHSAGGHLALWLAARHRLLSSSPLYTQKPTVIQGVIALGGVPDLKAYRTDAKNNCGGDVIDNLLENSSDKHYSDTSPKELLPIGIPQILIYGTQDNVAPVALGRAYQREAQKNGDPVKLILVKYAGHHEYIVPNSITWPQIKSEILYLLKYKVKK